MIDTSLGSNFI